MRWTPNFLQTPDSIGAADLENLLTDNAELTARLKEAEDTLAAIRSGDVDALVVGDDIYTLDSANAASNKLRKDVLAQMEDAVVAFDNRQHVIFMNAAAERQYGKDASDMPASGTIAYIEIRSLVTGKPSVQFDREVLSFLSADGKNLIIK